MVSFLPYRSVSSCIISNYCCYVMCARLGAGGDLFDRIQRTTSPPIVTVVSLMLRISCVRGTWCVSWGRPSGVRTRWWRLRRPESCRFGCRAVTLWLILPTSTTRTRLGALPRPSPCFTSCDRISSSFEAVARLVLYAFVFCVALLVVFISVARDPSRAPCTSLYRCLYLL